LEDREITWWMILSNKESAFALGCICLVTFNLFFWQAWLSTDLIALPGFQENMIGFVISLPSIVCLASYWLFPILFEESPRKLMFFLSHFGFFVTFLLMGPSQVFHFPLNKWFVIASMPLIGLFQTFVYLPLMPEIIERVQVEYSISPGRDEYLDSQLNDKVNDIYNFFFSIGCFTGPIIGGRMESIMKPRLTCDTVAFINLTWALVFLIFNCGCSVFKEHQEFQEKVALLYLSSEDDFATDLEEKFRDSSSSSEIDKTPLG
jgi:MFS family permease